MKYLISILLFSIPVFLIFPDSNIYISDSYFVNGLNTAPVLNDGEPIQNVPRSLKDEDHKVLSVKKREDGTYDLVVKKHGLLAD